MTVSALKRSARNPFHPYKGLRYRQQKAEEVQIAINTTCKQCKVLCDIVWVKIIDFYFMPKIIRTLKIMLHEDIL